MDKKRVLIITRAFYPDISPRSFRATELAKEFARQGHEVVVLTVRDEMHHDRFEKEHHVQIKSFGRLAFPEINFTDGGKVSLLVKRLFRRLLLVLLQYPEIEIMFKVKSAIKHECSYDLLVSIAVPHPIHWGVAWSFNRNADAPTAKAWIADCGDPFMGVSYDRFGKMFYFKYLEKWFCRKTDFITVPVEEARDAYYPEFRKKIRVIPQGFKFEEYEQDRSIYVPNEVPTFAYAGALMKGVRDPSALLNYLVSQNRDFKFYIYTKTPTMVLPFLEAAQGRLILKDYLPREELLKELSGMDFLVNINNITPQQVPSKLIDYYFTGRPVLSLESGGIDPAVINQFLEGDYRAQFKYEKIERFRIENVCKKFLSLCR